MQPKPYGRGITRQIRQTIPASGHQANDETLQRFKAKPPEAAHGVLGNKKQTFRKAKKWGASVARCPPNRAYLSLGSEHHVLANIIVGTCDLAR